MLKKIIALSIVFCLVLTVVGCKDTDEKTIGDQIDEVKTTVEKEVPAKVEVDVEVK